MTAEEMESNLGVIAKSGSLAFKKDLDAAMLAALKQTNEFVLSQGKPLDPMSKAAYEDILAHSGKNDG